MKVLMFGWEFPPHVSGGLGTACFGLTQALKQQGVDITFVLPASSPLNGRSPVRLLAADELDADPQAAPAPRPLGSILPDLAALTPYASAATFREWREEAGYQRHPRSLLLRASRDYGPDMAIQVWRYSRVGARVAASGKFDVIHAHDWMTFSAGVAAKLTSGKPLVVHVHSTEYDRTGGHPNPEIEAVERHGLEQADRVIAVSRRTARMLQKHYGLPAGRISVVHNAGDTPTPAPRRRADEPQTVLFLGRVTLQKGPDYFVEAAARVLRRMEERDLRVRFIMAGTGDMLATMIQRVAELRLHEYFHFTGFVEGEERERVFAVSDLYVMPSVSEPFGITPLEALKRGVPVIVSRQSGVTEVLPSVVPVDFWDIEALADEIVHILTDGEYAASLLAEAREDVSELNWDLAASRVRSVYTQLLAASE